MSTSFIHSQAGIPQILSKLIQQTPPPNHSRIIIKRLESNQAGSSLRDDFTKIIAQIKTNKKDRSSVELPATYQPRYTHTGTITGPKYVKVQAWSCDKHIRTKTDDQPYKNYSLLVGYAGANYIGNMRQPWLQTKNTIDEQLLLALQKSNWITGDAYWWPWKVQWQHASRTDRGVSAARQCYSLLMSPKSQDDVTILNANLPEDIRLFGLQQVSKKFLPRQNASARTYSYTLPTIAFSHYNDQTAQRDFRLAADRLKLVNDTLQQYHGTKNYHNFGSHKEHFEVNSMRTMLQLECGPPFVRDGVEFAVIRIKGMSFMMHQIRKMIGLMLAVVREVVDASVFVRAFSSHTLDIPTAPGLGLVLDQIHYDHFNKRRDVQSIDWSQYDAAVNAFREQHIHPIIIQSEIDEELIFQWVESLLIHTYEVVPEDQVNKLRGLKRHRDNDADAADGEEAVDERTT